MVTTKKRARAAESSFVGQFSLFLRTFESFSKDLFYCGLVTSKEIPHDSIFCVPLEIRTEQEAAPFVLFTRLSRQTVKELCEAVLNGAKRVPAAKTASNAKNPIPRFTVVLVFLEVFTVRSELNHPL